MTASIEGLRAATDDRLSRLFADLRIETPETYRLGDGPMISVSGGSADPKPPAASRDALSAGLSLTIYAAAYARLYVGPGFDPASLPRGSAPDPAFVADLEAANPSRSAWELGWTVFGRDPDGAIHVAKGDNAVKLLPGRFAMADLLRAPHPGDEIERRRERSSLTHQVGLYHVFGEAPRNDYDEARLSRFYFDVPADRAAWLLRLVATSLNRYGVPFTYKCPVDPAAYDRIDAAVLYVARRWAPVVVTLLAPAEHALASALQGRVPLWTLPVLPGVGAADDPGTGESFGQSRSLFVAQGIVDAWAAGSSDVATRREGVAARFRRAGLSVTRPHLGLGLIDIYVPDPDGVAVRRAVSSEAATELAP